MTGYTADEKLRVEQISNLRRKWLKDQELSPREPVLPKTAPGPVAKFWAGFLEPKTLWRLYVSLSFCNFILIYLNEQRCVNWIRMTN